MHRLVFVALVILGLEAIPWSAEMSEVPECIAEMVEEIRTHSFDDSLPICSVAAAPWVIRLHRSTIGPMTDGTALGVLHMPQPDNIPQEDRPLPVALLPRSENVWYIGYIYSGEVLPELIQHRYFLWAPGHNRHNWTPDEVDWGDDAARMFRCLAYEGERCITYYPIRNCSIDDPAGSEYMLSVRRQDNIDVIEMLDSFGSVDKLVRLVNEAAWAALCERSE